MPAQSAAGKIAHEQFAPEDDEINTRTNHPGNNHVLGAARITRHDTPPVAIVAKIFVGVICLRRNIGDNWPPAMIHAAMFAHLVLFGLDGRLTLYNICIRSESKAVFVANGALVFAPFWATESGLEALSHTSMNLRLLVRKQHAHFERGSWEFERKRSCDRLILFPPHLLECFHHARPATHWHLQD